MDVVKDKDPRRQQLGKEAKAKGQRFEARIDATFDYYRETGFALIEKTPEPMHPLKNLGNGRFVACFVKKAQPDYKGIVKGGREYIFEAKYTSSTRMEQSRVQEIQDAYMTEHEALGARCFVLAGFDSGEVYCIPWRVWKGMKKQFGRKYVTEADLEEYRVKLAWNDVLLILK